MGFKLLFPFVLLHFINTVQRYIYSYNFTRHNNTVVASSMYHIIFIKTENIAVDDMLTSTSTHS